MTKNYKTTLYLDRESVEIVKDFLDKTGQSLSGWVNAFVMEMAQEIKGQPSPLMKPVDEMTVKEFGEIMGYWFKKVRGSDEAEESSSTS